MDEILIFPSEARALQQDYTSEEFTVRSGRGLVLLLDVTAVTSTPNLSKVQVQAKGPGGTWATVYQFTGLTIATTGLRAFCIYPGAASAASWHAAPLQGPLFRRMRVLITHDDTDSITYSLAGHFPA